VGPRERVRMFSQNGGTQNLIKRKKRKGCSHWGLCSCLVFRFTCPKLCRVIGVGVEIFRKKRSFNGRYEKGTDVAVLESSKTPGEREGDHQL